MVFYVFLGNFEFAWGHGAVFVVWRLCACFQLDFMIEGSMGRELVGLFGEEYVDKVLWGKLGLDVLSVHGWFAFQEFVDVGFGDLVEE